MKTISIYFEGNIVDRIKCSKVILEKELKLYLFYIPDAEDDLKEILIASVPMDHAIIKEECK